MMSIVNNNIIKIVMIVFNSGSNITSGVDDTVSNRVMLLTRDSNMTSILNDNVSKMFM